MTPPEASRIDLYETTYYDYSVNLEAEHTKQALVTLGDTRKLVFHPDKTQDGHPTFSDITELSKDIRHLHADTLGTMLINPRPPPHLRSPEKIMAWIIQRKAMGMPVEILKDVPPLEVPKSLAFGQRRSFSYTRDSSNSALENKLSRDEELQWGQQWESAKNSHPEQTFSMPVSERPIPEPQQETPIVPPGKGRKRRKNDSDPEDIAMDAEKDTDLDERANKRVREDPENTPEMDWQEEYHDGLQYDEMECDSEDRSTEKDGISWLDAAMSDAGVVDRTDSKSLPDQSSYIWLEDLGSRPESHDPILRRFDRDAFMHCKMWDSE